MALTGERWSDLVSEMYCLVHEQAPLHEVTSRVVDVGTDGDTVTHRPWNPAECRSVLLPWQRNGWLDLVADVDPPHGGLGGMWRDQAARDGAYLVLSSADASALLADPSRWRVGTADGHVMLCLSDEGSRHAYDEWVERTGG